MVSLAIFGWLGISLLIFFRQPESGPLLTVVYPAFFKSLVSIQFKLPDSFVSSLLAECISLFLHGVVGLLFLRLFVRLPKLVEWIASVFVGIGLATLILEFWAMAFLLNRWTVLLSLLGLGLFFYAAQKYGGWAQAEGPLPSESPESIDADRVKIQERPFFWTVYAILAAITVLSFYHALLFPVNYWDALILYIHYGKMTYQQGGFPILVCLQVGLGLGANYPHLYPLHQAATGMIFGGWSDLYGQLLPPLAGLGSMFVLYSLCRKLGQSRLAAILAVLVFRSMPYVSTYFVWASDYSLVMLYTTLFLLFLEGFLSHTSIRRLMPLLAVSAIFPHINYLGWIVWPTVILAILWRYRELALMQNLAWMKIGAWVVFWIALGLTWYVRNGWVTGNPVYAFFPQFFGGKNINLEVLASCNQEWTAHGMGAARLGKTLGQKIIHSLFYFQVDWRFAPMLTGIMLPGFLLGWKRKQPFYWIAASLFAAYFAYQYIISGLYWYHTIAVCPILGVYAGRFLSQITHRKIMAGYSVLLIVAALVPGVSLAIMGPKIPDPSLPSFRHPGLSLEDFNRYAYPNEAPAWRYINQNLEPNAVILSHDNRYHVYRDDIQIIHLDDCGLTPFYGKPYPEIHRELLRRGVQYYLFIPDEHSHPITARLGHLSLLDNTDYFQLLFRSGNNQDSLRLYRLVE